MARLAAAESRLTLLDHRRTAEAKRCVNAKIDSLKLQIAKLDALSPLAVLIRGYSITQAVDGRVLRDPSETKPGDRLVIRLEKGKLDAEVIAAE